VAWQKEIAEKLNFRNFLSIGDLSIIVHSLLFLAMWLVQQGGEASFRDIDSVDHVIVPCTFPRKGAIPFQAMVLWFTHAWLIFLE
jgi:hypothetical protein